MNEKPTQSVADRLKELATLLARATQVVNGIPTTLNAAPVTAVELATIRDADSEQQERVIARVRSAARRRLKERIEESVRLEVAMTQAAARGHEILALIAHVRGRAAELASDGDNAGLDEIERSIESATRKKKLAGAA